jgi:hypothetical protein
LALTSCSQPKTPWWEQLETGGPCHEANLLDGLDTESGDELRNIAYCLNQHGNLDALMPLVESTRQPTRDGEEAGTHLALGLNGLLQAEIDVFRFSTQLLGWMENDTGLLDSGLKILVEMTYGQAYSQLEDQAAPTAQSAIDQGVIAPFLGGIRAGLVAALDADLAPLDVAESALNSPRTLALIHSLAGMVNSPNAGFKHRVEDLTEDFGQAIQTAQSPNNDRWNGASGDSLRDLVEALAFNRDATGRRAIDLVELAADSIFSDTIARGRVRTALEGLAERDALRSMPLQLRYLGSVDTRGTQLSAGEDSALVSLLRLLHNANTSVNCSIQWGIYTYEIRLGNLSVALLEAISELDPELSANGIDLLGGILGLPLSDVLLQTVAALGICPVLDAEFAEDLQSLDRFNDTGSGDLLRVLIQVLKALGQGQDSRIPEVVELLSISEAIGATEPLEELLRDWGGTPFLESLAAFSDPILEPSGFIDESRFPSGVAPLDFDDIWAILETSFDAPNNGKNPLRKLEPLILALLGQEGTWDGVHALGTLLGDSRAHSQDLLLLLPQIVELDPDLDLTRTLVSILFEKETAGHFAQALEVDALFQAVTTSTEAQPGPLAFFSELQLSGTLETLLGTLDRVFGLLVPPKN